MKSYIVVEGAFDAALISTLMERILPEQELVVTEAGDKSLAQQKMMTHMLVV